MQTILDLEGVVQVRVVDQALPAHGGTRFFEIHPHHQVQRVGHFFGQGLQARCVFMRGLDVVDGAGADHDEQAVILAIENIAHHVTASSHGLQGLGAKGDFLLELVGGDQRLVGCNVQVIDR